MRPAGSFDSRVAILRRPVIPPVAGKTRGEFQPAPGLDMLEACLMRAKGSAVIEAGFPSDGIELVVELRDCAATRTIVAADRLRVEGEALDYAIEAVVPQPRRSGAILLHCSRRRGG